MEWELAASLPVTTITPYHADMMKVNEGHRARLHELCKAALSVDKNISFVAILDSSGRMIVGHVKNSTFNIEEWRSFIFYRDFLRPVIARINTPGDEINNIGFQSFNIAGSSDTIYVAQLSEIDYGHENKKSKYFLAVLQT